MGQYSSLCGFALGLILGGFDTVEVDVQDREQVDSGEKVEARERERKKTSWMTCRWSERARCDILSHNVMCAQGQICREKVSREVYDVYTSCIHFLGHQTCKLSFSLQRSSALVPRGNGGEAQRLDLSSLADDLNRNSCDTEEDYFPECQKWGVLLHSDMTLGRMRRRASTTRSTSSQPRDSPQPH